MSTAITFARASVARFIRAERRTYLPAEIVMNRAVNFADRMATAKAKDGHAELSDAYAAVTSWLGASRDRLNARRAPAVLEPLIRRFEPGNPVLVDSGREGRVTSVHDGFVWVSVKDPMVNTGWRPSNGYHPADVVHAPAVGDIDEPIPYVPVRLCYHPRSCVACDAYAEPCGKHQVGAPGHEECAGHDSAPAPSSSQAGVAAHQHSPTRFGGVTPSDGSTISPASAVVHAAIQWAQVHQADAADVTPLQLFDADDALHMAVTAYRKAVGQ